MKGLKKTLDIKELPRYGKGDIGTLFWKYQIVLIGLLLISGFNCTFGLVNIILLQS